MAQSRRDALLHSPQGMPRLNLVVIGASAGGLQALLDIFLELTPQVAVPILVVVHTPAGRESNLPDVLSRGSNLPVSFVERDQVLRNGHVYVAPPDQHVLVTGTGATLNHGPKENGFRPAIDPLFRSAARIHGSRVMGIILSGALDDGVYGLKMIKDAGGVTVAQDPAEAVVPSMPLSALRYVAVDHVLRTRSIAALISESAGTPEEKTAMARKTKHDDPDQQPSMTIDEMKRAYGPASALSCPDCGGALWEIEDGQLVRYRCHVGHQYSSQGLDNGQNDVVEEALWTAVRVLEEHADLRARMSRRADMAGLDAVSSSFAESADLAHRQAQSIRDVLVANGMPAIGTSPNGSPVPSRPAAAPLKARTAAKRKASKTRR